MLIKLDSLTHSLRCFINLKIHISKKQIADVETPLTLDGEFVKLDGKDYYVIKTVNAHMEVSLMKLETKCKNLYGWVNKKLNSVFNDHWKLFKSELDESLNKYIGDIINEILKPVLEKVAVQDLYQN